MIYSKTCEYAIRALSYAASRKGLPPVSVKEVSAEAGVPQAYATKIFQCLIKAKVLDSKSGPGGGYSFRIPPSQLTLAHVIAVLDDLPRSPFSKCVMGQRICNARHACALHHIWSRARDKMNRILRKKTISGVASMKNKFDWNPKRRVVLSKRMQKIFGYKSW